MASLANATTLHLSSFGVSKCPLLPLAKTPSRQRPLRTVTSASKGFGASSSSAEPKTTKREKTKQGKSFMPAVKAAEADTCPCGGGGDKRPYKECCGRFHGGVKEPDPLTLLKARYTAFAKGVIPYLVRTTHPTNSDLQKDGEEQLAADCKETCQRLVFKRLDAGEVESGENENEAFISFRAVYVYKHGTTTENQLLVEKSRFVKEGDRWYYSDKVAVDAVSDALWRHGGLLAEQEKPSTPLVKGIYGRAQPKLRPRSK